MVNGDADCRGRWGFDLVLKFLKMIFFFLNIPKSQTILLVGTVLKLFGYLTTRDQMTYFPTVQQLRWILGPVRHWT